MFLFLEVLVSSIIGQVPPFLRFFCSCINIFHSGDKPYLMACFNVVFLQADSRILFSAPYDGCFLSYGIFLQPLLH